MPKTIEAVFEKGVLIPTSPLNISEHKKVTLIIKVSSKMSRWNLLIFFPSRQWYTTDFPPVFLDVTV
jgi:hypothetical protein